MKTLTFLVSRILELYTVVLLLHVWMQWIRCNFYNPFSEFMLKIIHPLINLLRRFFIPNIGSIDSASLLFAFVLCIIKAILFLSTITFKPIVWIAAILILLKITGLLIFWILTLMAIINGISQKFNSIKYALTQLSEPLLRPIRNLLPKRDGIDFSSIIFIILLYIINIGIIKLLQATDNALLLEVWMML